MPTGNQSRHAFAPRAAYPRLATPSLPDTKLSCSSPFLDPDLVLDQAGALLSLLGYAFSSADEFEDIAHAAGKLPDRDYSDFKRLRGALFKDALDGVASLIAVSRHLNSLDCMQAHNDFAVREGR